MMSGLPAAGKDHWIASNPLGLPMVSLDTIRAELAAPRRSGQGHVVTRAKEQARGLLRQGTSFIWNATNTTSTLRRQLTGLFRDYQARVEIVYVEAAWQKLLARNRARPRPVPEHVLYKLAKRLDVPTVAEAHAVSHCVS